MARSKQTGGKKEREKNKQKKKLKKEERKVERLKNSTRGMGLDALEIASQGQTYTAKAVVVLPSAVQQESKTKSILASAIREGRVSYYNEQKDYGFIRDTHIKENVIFTISSLSFTLKLNDKVSFVKAKGPKGYLAQSIQKLD